VIACVRAALLGAVLLGGVMTAGDFVWANWRVPHRVVYGLVHGAVMCFCIGSVIGVRARRGLAGALAGPVVGVVAAGMFYLLAPWLRWSAMLPAWMLFWLLFAVLQQRLRRDEPATGALLRGLLAAVASGAAFYAISGIWTRPSRGGPDYSVHFVSWTLAFLPGFLALFWPFPRRIIERKDGAHTSERPP
jgi:hypothetical protein